LPANAHLPDKTMKYYITLFLLFCATCSFAQHSASLVGDPGAAGAKIAYVNIDSLEAGYTLLASKRADFAKREEELDRRLQQEYQDMQNDADSIQKKATANNLTQEEYEQAEKRLMQKKETLDAKKDAYTEELKKDEEAVNSDLSTRLNAFLEQYNKTHHYDCILSYSWTNSAILFIDKRLDITRQVIDGMNARSQN